MGEIGRSEIRSVGRAAQYGRLRVVSPARSDNLATDRWFVSSQVARASARQIASIRSASSRVIDSVRSALGTFRRLSRLTARAAGIPSSGPSSTSVRASAARVPRDCFCSRAGAGWTIPMATTRSLTSKPVWTVVHSRRRVPVGVKREPRSQGGPLAPSRAESHRFCASVGCRLPSTRLSTESVGRVPLGL